MLNTIKDPMINSKRQLELDIAKGIAVFCMIAVHVQSNLAVKETAYTAFGGIIEFLGTLPAAPVFMFLLGTGVIYSKNSSYKDNIKRGEHILALGYLLNIIRTGVIFLPFVFKGIWMDKIGCIIEGIITIDILQFVGIALIFFGILKKINASLLTITIVTISISIANFLLLLYKTDNYILSSITGLFWGSNDWSSFPFATWIFYTIAGYLFGCFLIRQTNKNKFYNSIFIFSALSLFILSVLAYIFHLDTGLMTELGYYHHTLYSNILYSSFILAWISVIYYITKFLPIICTNTLKRWSYNVNSIYFTHWILISIVIAITGSQKLQGFSYLFYFIAILTISDFIAYFYKTKVLKR